MSPHSLQEFLPFFKGFLDTVREGIVVVDSECNVIFSNQSATTDFRNRWGAGSEQGLNFKDPKFKGFYKDISENIEKAVSSKEIQKHRITRSKNGDSHFDTIFRPILSPANVVMGVSITSIDVTDYVNISKELTKREATLNAVLNATPDGIYALNKELEFIAINPKAVKDFDRAGYEVNKGVSLHNIIEATRLERWKNTYFNPVFKGKPVTYEGPVDSPDQEIYYLQNKYRPVYDEEGNIFAVLEISRDVTEAITQKKVIESQLEDLDLQNKELNRYIDSNLQLENFAYIASHDLKAPLRSVVSFAQLLRDKVYSNIDEKSKSYLDIVVESSQNMQNLIDDLLLYSRVKTTTIKLREIDLNNLFNRIIMELEADIDEQQAIINLPKVLPTIVGDESLLIQLFSNLIRNAIKFQPPGQQPIVDVELSEDILFWKFSVRDNGIGIDEMNFAKIFGTFEKLHSNDQYEGTGLGLTICRQIVEKHGGLISLSSQKSKGTVFKFGISKKLEVEVVKST